MVDEYKFFYLRFHAPHPPLLISYLFNPDHIRKREQIIGTYWSGLINNEIRAECGSSPYIFWYPSNGHFPYLLFNIIVWPLMDKSRK